MGYYIYNTLLIPLQYFILHCKYKRCYSLPIAILLSSKVRSSYTFIILYKELQTQRQLCSLYYLLYSKYWGFLLQSTPRALGGNGGRHIYMRLFVMYLLISFVRSSLVGHTCNGYGRRPFTLVVLWSLGSLLSS